MLRDTKHFIEREESLLKVTSEVLFVAMSRSVSHQGKTRCHEVICSHCGFSIRAGTQRRERQPPLRS